jgi:hypothetical protein
MSRTKRLKIGLLIAFALETFCITYWIELTSYKAWFSVLYFVMGILIALLALSFQELNFSYFRKIGSFNGWVFIKAALMGILGTSMYLLSRFWMDTLPLDAKTADMLPIIRVMDQRFIGGHWSHIYDPIPSIWNGIKPIYLPAMWLPFVPSVLFHFDMRWITVGGLFVAFSSYLIIFYPKREKALTLVSFMIAVILFLYLFTEEIHGYIPMTEEGVVVAYYVLLVLSLVSGNMVFTGIAASVCMLSRYALIGWIPAFLFYLWLRRQRKQALIFAASGLCCLLVLCIIPFGLGPLIDLAGLPGRYISFAKVIWKDSPEVYEYGLGFAKLFGPERIPLLHTLLIGFSFCVPILFVGICSFLSRKKSISNIPLAALKISVVFFFCFLEVPYLYLFYTSSFISLIMVAFFLRQQDHAGISLRKAVLKSHDT